MTSARFTAMLAFAAGQFDLTFPYEITVAMLKNLRSQIPQAICEITPMRRFARANGRGPWVGNPQTRESGQLLPLDLLSSDNDAV